MVIYKVIKATTIMIVYAELELYTLRTNNINNPPLLPLHDSEDYAACCFVVEDENFPGYVKLSLAEMKTNSIYLNHFTRMNDGKQYLPNSMMMDYSYKQVQIMTETFSSSELEHSQDIFQGIYINGPAHTIDNKENGLLNGRILYVAFITTCGQIRQTRS